MAGVHFLHTHGISRDRLNRFFLRKTGFCILLLSLGLSACQSKPSRSTRGRMISPVPRNLPEINLYGSSATPPTSLSRDEYPFSADGTYVEAWAVAGEARAGRSSYVSSSEPRRATVTPKRSSATSRKPVKSSSRASSSRSTSTKKKAPARSSSSKTKKKR